MLSDCCLQFVVAAAGACVAAAADIDNQWAGHICDAG